MVEDLLAKYLSKCVRPQIRFETKAVMDITHKKKERQVSQSDQRYAHEHALYAYLSIAGRKAFTV